MAAAATTVTAMINHAQRRQRADLAPANPFEEAFRRAASGGGGAAAAAKGADVSRHSRALRSLRHCCRACPPNPLCSGQHRLLFSALPSPSFCSVPNTTPAARCHPPQWQRRPPGGVAWCRCRPCQHRLVRAVCGARRLAPPAAGQYTRLVCLVAQIWAAQTRSQIRTTAVAAGL